MNVTSDLSLADDSESNDWNSTATTASAWSSRLFSSSGFRWSQYATAVVLWIIFVFGTVGNLVVLVVLVWRRSRSQVGTQLFLGSLAVADIGLMSNISVISNIFRKQLDN